MFRCTVPECVKEWKDKGFNVGFDGLYLDMINHFVKKHPELRSEMDRHLERKIDGKWYKLDNTVVKGSDAIAIETSKDQKEPVPVVAPVKKKSD